MAHSLYSLVNELTQHNVWVTFWCAQFTALYKTTCHLHTTEKYGITACTVVQAVVLYKPWSCQWERAIFEDMCLF